MLYLVETQKAVSVAIVIWREGLVYKKASKK